MNIWKTSEAANLVFQWIFVLNSVKHKFFLVSIVNIKSKIWSRFLSRESFFFSKTGPFFSGMIHTHPRTHSHRDLHPHPHTEWKAEGLSRIQNNVTTVLPHIGILLGNTVFVIIGSRYHCFLSLNETSMPYLNLPSEIAETLWIVALDWPLQCNFILL